MTTARLDLLLDFLFRNLILNDLAFQSLMGIQGILRELAEQEFSLGDQFLIVLLLNDLSLPQEPRLRRPMKGNSRCFQNL